MTRSRTILLTALLFPVLSLPIAASPEAPAADGVLSGMRAHAEKAGPSWIEIRRQIHSHPELSGEEEKTGALVAERLRELGLEVRTGIGGHGVVGVLRGGKEGPVAAYRADMDAVRSPVVGDPPYRSTVPGVKHVCGHDAHVAIGLGVAELLAAQRERLPGTVVFLFQPAEETVEGARAMIADGAIEDPAPGAYFALHTAPFPAGTIGVAPGAGLTGWITFEIHLRPDGDRADALAEKIRSLDTVGVSLSGDDPMAAMGAVLAGMTAEDGPLEEFVYLQLSRTESAEGHSLSGTLRAANDPVYERTLQQLSRLVDETAPDATLSVGERFPDMHSHPGLSLAAVEPIEQALGEGSTLRIHASAPFFGEDFALFREHAPTAMFFLGVANPEKGIAAFNHAPDYDLDESAIPRGALAMANVLLHHLGACGSP